MPTPIQGLPAGATVDNTPVPAQSAISGLPPGATVDSTPVPGGTPTGMISQNNGPDSLDIHPDDNPLLKVAKGANKVGAGAGTGLLDTITGGMGVENRIASHLPSGVATALFGPQDERNQTKDLLQHKRDELASQNSTDPGYGNVGYGGESLLEFFLGDEAIKGLSLADKAAAASKTLKVVEKSPKLMEAIKIGAKHLAAQSARAGAVQGAQSFVRSGGDISEGAKGAAEGAATAGVIEGALGTAGAVASKVGDTIVKGSESAGKLAEAAANAPDKQTIVQNIQGQLLNAEKDLHSNYESGIQDIQNRLGDNAVDAKNSPMSTKAKELLANPVPEDHPWTAQAKNVAGDKLDASTRGLLENVANGVKPLTDEDIQAAEKASKPSGLLDSSGNPVKAEKVEPQAQSVGPLTIKDLIAQRQAIRKAADAYEPGDVNARALKSMLFSIDDTIDQVAQKAGDPEALTDYRKLRSDYKDKINAFHNPVIDNLMNGKPDDAAKAFVATKNASGLPAAGKTLFNAQQLKTVLGEEGFNQFRNQIFDGMLKSASDEKQGFNPAKFVDLWKRVADGTKSDVFDVDPQKNVLPRNYINQLTEDAKTAANLQKLVRAGIIAGAGTAATVGESIAPGVTSGALGTMTMLGLLAGHVGEGGGSLAKGREVIDYIANNPKTWAALRNTGKIIEGEATPATRAGKAVVGTAKFAGKVANAAPALGQAGVTLGNASGEKDYNDKSSLQRIMQGPAQALGGSSPNPKQATVAYDSGPMAGKSIPGMVQKGNIDLNHRPQIKNADGSSSTIFSMTVPVNKDGSVFQGKYEDAPQYALVPSIANGKFLTADGKKPDEHNRKQMEALQDKATDYYSRTREHLGIFKTNSDADKYAGLTHAYGADGTDKKVYAPYPVKGQQKD